MQINQISYRRSKNVSYREHENIEVSASVAPDDDPQETLLYLQNWVNEKLEIREEIAKLGITKERLENEIDDLARSARQAKDKWQKVQEFLEKAGLENVDDIPF